MPRISTPHRQTFVAGPWLCLIILAVTLSWMFWWPLWQGGGLIGGDIYPYFFPQKQLLAESLKQGEIPLWNPLVGFGYPVLGESQTAALYPPNLVLYRCFSLNTAYNISQLGHYLFAFVGTIAFTRRLGLNWNGSILAAVVFVYGWFPARICLEWAIIGGAWFVWILWGATAFLQTGQRRYWGFTALFLGLDLLAGHYNLAFITLLALIPLPWLVGQKKANASDGGLARPVSPFSRRSLVGLGSAIVIGFLLAGVQLMPTWELKSLSQRQQVSEVFAPAYGHLPIKALSQLWNPWGWYTGEKSFDELLGTPSVTSVPVPTNQAEAQFYLGILPLLLAIAGLAIPGIRKQLPLHSPWGWLGMIIFSLILASGWPTWLFSNLPGLGFFRGPGRYSIMAALAIALLAGATWETFLKCRNWSTGPAVVMTALLLAITAIDLWTASRQYQFQNGPYFGRQVFYAIMVNDAAIRHRDESSLRQAFLEQGGRGRLYAPGQNIPTLLNVSALPVYLGLGPEVYESDLIRVDFSLSQPEEIQDAVSRLRRFGVTHLLLESPLETSIWPVTFLGPVIDPLLNRALARRDPFYFYELNDASGRVSLLDTSDGQIHSVQVRPNSVTIELTSPQSATVMLRDLRYPGWKCSHEVVPEDASCDTLFRCAKVEGSPERQTIIWTYRPRSVFIGGVVSLIGAILLGFGCYWTHRKETPPAQQA
ncbi:MAG TPA: hypothetical protein VNQ76_05900 [Planctomicrobium sp.]|nr:hypothetical protein [Planctomicrobium sp.]